MLTELAPGHFAARVLVRDGSGKRRDITRVSPLKLDSLGRKIPDRNGSRASDAVLAAAREIRIAVQGELTDSITVRKLWELYRNHLVALERAANTLERYDDVAAAFNKAFGSLRLYEVSTAAAEKFLVEVGQTQGPGSMDTARSVLSGMFKYAVRKTPLTVNPVREVELPENLEPKGRTGGARDITVAELRFIVTAVRTSILPCPRKLMKQELERAKPIKSYTPPTVAEFCEAADLTDWVTLLSGTGLRRSQILALLWSDIDLEGKTLRTSGKVVRITGIGLVRQEIENDPKNRKGRIALPDFTIVMLKNRKAMLESRKRTHPPTKTPEYDLVFPSENWTLRDPGNVQHQWQRVRDALGIPEDITAHSFRGAVATILDDAGLSARITADVLGHADPSMTQRRYMARGRVHPTAADALHRAVSDD
ncbi:tyrosine-type recombinase/integrase [Nocardia sp. NBC_01503]|uniref:site-specific integrase n=1 Tax=Nocardia sp. NBC_01503 TaxID=2975997 RepID=UPI002E7C22EE|nr:tyrosine-type recombinase/integrase [Nocardia sp. NBC_01503]WTL36195.1 tyrosine-type recombinase/integrase [Nocardia sp. NBC_01503]